MTPILAPPLRDVLLLSAPVPAEDPTPSRRAVIQSPHCGVSTSGEPLTDKTVAVSALLARARAGDDEALNRVIAALYRELHSIAARQMRGEARQHTLQPTALVNEALVRLLRGPGEILDRNHFLALASQTMRRVLVDYARQKRSHKRGRGVERVTLDDNLPVGTRPQPVDVLDMDEALSELEVNRPRACRIVELKFFGGHTDKEVAEILGLSLPTVRRDWDAAKTWLQSRLRPGAAPRAR